MIGGHNIKWLGITLTVLGSVIGFKVLTRVLGGSSGEVLLETAGQPVLWGSLVVIVIGIPLVVFGLFLERRKKRLQEEERYLQPFNPDKYIK